MYETIGGYGQTNINTYTLAHTSYVTNVMCVMCINDWNTCVPDKIYVLLFVLWNVPSYILYVILHNLVCVRCRYC